MSINPQVCLVGWCMDARGVLASLASIAVLLALVLGVLLFDALRTVTRSQAAARANRHATLSSLVGVGMLVLVLAGLVAGFLLGVPFMVGNGRLLALVPAAAGLCLLGAQALGQVTWPRPTGAVREAELTRRVVADVAPRPSRTLLFVWAGAAVALLVMFGLVADTPRAMILTVGGHAEPIGPYPGWYYGVPLIIAVVGLVAATELVLRLIMLRPAVMGVSAEWDLHLRRRSAGHVTRGMQLVLATTTSGILLVAGWAHLALGRNAYALKGGGWGYLGSPAQHWLGAGLLLAAAGVLLVSLGSTVLPPRRGRRKAVRPLEAAAP